MGAAPLIYRFKFTYLSGRNLLSKALAYSLHCTKNALATIKLAKAFSLLNYRINFVTVNFGFKFIEITFVFFCRVIFL